MPISRANGPAASSHIAAPSPQFLAVIPIPNGIRVPNSSAASLTAGAVPLFPGIAEYSSPFSTEYQPAFAKPNDSRAGQRESAQCHTQCASERPSCHFLLMTRSIATSDLK